MLSVASCLGDEAVQQQQQLRGMAERPSSSMQQTKNAGYSSLQGFQLVDPALLL
jgi:hypothetical protein